MINYELVFFLLIRQTKFDEESNFISTNNVSNFVDVRASKESNEAKIVQLSQNVSTIRFVCFLFLLLSFKFEL